MNPIRKFEEFVASGVVKRRSPDKPRSEFLFREAEKENAFLLELIGKIPVASKNANSYIKQCYDILMGLIRANMLLEGYHASGFGAHEAEISYLRIFGFKEVDVQFADQMRYFRNGMLYYGTGLDVEYARKVLEFLGRLYPRLMEEVKSG